MAAALDPRIAAAVPFNFGGPQPETRYPLPEDAETSFNYAGSGSWESTRNLRRSAADGFLPWVIVGGIAPRRLVFAHEFNWHRERDPVWKRLQAIYGFYDARDRLGYTHGRGELRGRPPESTHCTHIGRVHRVMIHAAFDRWFDIHVASDDERLTREWILQLKLGRVDTSYFAGKFGVDVLEKFRPALERLEGRKMLEVQGAAVRLTRDGLLRVDSLLPEFYEERYRGARYT